MLKERWRKFPINKNYEISNRGKVRSIDRWVINKNGRKHWINGKRLKPQKWKSGYLFVTISHPQTGQKQYSIHRLVAITWIKNKENLPQVNHKKGNKKNNYYKELEWCTQAQNNLHAYRTGIKKHHKCWKGKSGYKHNKSKEVIVYNLRTGKEIHRYGSTHEAGRKCGISQGTVSNCCLGKIYGYLGKGYKYSK